MTCSALPHTQVALLTPFSAAFAAASSIALGTLSMPTTALTRAARLMPIVPVPQHTSSSSVLALAAAQAPAR